MFAVSDVHVCPVTISFCNSKSHAPRLCIVMEGLTGILEAEEDSYMGLSLYRELLYTGVSYIGGVCLELPVCKRSPI